MTKDPLVDSSVFFNILEDRLGDLVFDLIFQFGLGPLQYHLEQVGIMFARLVAENLFDNFWIDFCEMMTTLDIWVRNCLPACHLFDLESLPEQDLLISPEVQSTHMHCLECPRLSEATISNMEDCIKAQTESTYVKMEQCSRGMQKVA